MVRGWVKDCGAKVVLKNKKPRLVWRGRKTTNYNPMNIFDPRGCGSISCVLQPKRRLNGWQRKNVADELLLTRRLILEHY